VVGLEGAVGSLEVDAPYHGDREENGVNVAGSVTELVAELTKYCDGVESGDDESVNSCESDGQDEVVESQVALMEGDEE